MINLLKRFAPVQLMLILLLMASIPSMAQDIPGMEQAKREIPPLRQRLIFGGNFGLQFGTVTYIEASPVIGVWLLPRLSVAAGPYYRFLKDPDGSTDIFGGRVYSRFYFVRELDNIIPLGFNMGLYLHSEYENLSLRSDWILTSYDRSRVNMNVVLAGVGVSQYTGPRGSINFSVLWGVKQTMFELNDSPEFRIGFTF